MSASATPSSGLNFCTPENFDPSRVIFKAAVPKEIMTQSGKLTYFEMPVQYNYSVDSTVRPDVLQIQLWNMETSGIQKNNAKGSTVDSGKHQMKFDFSSEKLEDVAFVAKMEKFRDVCDAKIKEYDGTKQMSELFFYPKGTNKLPIKTGWKKVSLYVKMKSFVAKETGKVVMLSKFIRHTSGGGKAPIDDWSMLMVDKRRLTHKALLVIPKITIVNKASICVQHTSSIVYRLSTPTLNEVQEATMDEDVIDEKAMEDVKAMEALLGGSSTKVDSSAPSMFGPEVKQSSPSSLPPPPLVTDSLKGLTVIPPATSSPPAPAVPPSLPGLTPLPPGLAPLPPK